MTATGQIYWRVEWHNGDVLTAPMLSTGWAGVDGRKPKIKQGLSACESAKVLHAYFRRWIEVCGIMPNLEPEEDHPDFAAYQRDAAEIEKRSHRVPHESSRVIAMLGDRVGTCQDGQPLVEPEIVVLETTWGAIADCLCLDYLKDVEAEHLARVLTMEPAPRGLREEREQYLVGPWIAYMTAEEARRWNAGDITPEDESNVCIHDASNDWYIRLGDAFCIPMVARYLEGAEAVKED